MISFECDYNNGAHPDVLQHLLETNKKQSLTYGDDCWSNHAKEEIKEACAAPHADIFFLVGGTQANATAIDSMLESYQGVITTECGHINVHEAGAIEAAGHKVIALPQHNGLLDAKELDDYLHSFYADESYEHMVQPGLVYVTYPSEYGTLYTAQQLADIHLICRKYGLKLYVDGARLGYGLMADGNDISLPFLASHCDVFYIGGTKVGALCGEAVVYPHGNAPRHIFTIIKRHGALVAKSRMIGLQFDALFAHQLYFKISKQALEKAQEMKQLFLDKRYPFYIESPTNQQFVILPNEEVERLSKHVLFSRWGSYDTRHTICRFVTSWSTTSEEIEALRNILG